jgi:hypothetical protein
LQFYKITGGAFCAARFAFRAARNPGGSPLRPFLRFENKLI